MLKMSHRVTERQTYSMTLTDRQSSNTDILTKIDS